MHHIASCLKKSWVYFNRMSDLMIIFRHCVQESWGAELHKDLKVTKEIREKEIDILWWDFLTWLQNPIGCGRKHKENHHKECHHFYLQIRILIWSGSPLWSSYSQGSQPRHWLLLGVLWQRKTRQDKPWGVDQEGGVSQSWNIFLFNLTFPLRVAQTPMSVVSPPTCVLVGHINKLWNV